MSNEVNQEELNLEEESKKQLKKIRDLHKEQNDLLTTNYNTQRNAINQSEQNALQSASISNQKLMKYLGQSQLANGIAKGQATSDFINANNNYQQNRATIHNDSISQQNELLNSYNQNIINNDYKLLENEQNILDRYRQQQVEDREWEDYKNQDTLNNPSYNDKSWLQAAINRIDSLIEKDEITGKITPQSQEEINKILEEYEGEFTDSRYYDLLLDMYKTAINTGSIKIEDSEFD